MDFSRSGFNTPVYFDLACVTIAAVFWYLSPDLGGWALVIALAPWLSRLLITGKPSARTPFDIPLLIFLLTAGVSVWAAFDFESAMAKFWIVLGGILLFYAFANAILVNPPTMPRHLARSLVLPGAVVAIYFLATNDWNQNPGNIASLTEIGHHLQARLPVLPGHRLHPNVAGGILAVLAPFGVAVVLDLKNQGDVNGRALVKMGIALTLVAVMLLGLLMSSSRGAWIGVGAAVLLALWRLVAASFTRSRPARFAGLFLGGLIISAIVLIPLASSQIETLPPIPAVQLPSAQTFDVIDSRAELYRNSLILVLDYAFIGAGLGGFTMLYSTYSLLIHVGFASHSHNLFLDIPIQQGVVALLALLWAWAFVARQSLREVSLDVWRGAAAFSIVVIAIHGLMDDPFYGSRALLLMFMPLAFFVGEAKGLPGQTTGKPALRGKRHPLPAFAISALGFAAIIWYKPLLSQWYSNLGSVEQSRVELGTYAWPEWPLQDEVRRELDISRAVDYYERALALNPGNPSANRRLGQIELSLGEYEDALTHLTVAYEVTPWDNATRQLLGEAYLVNGRLAEGRAIWSSLVSAHKQFEIRAYWYEHIGDTQRLSWIQSSVP